MRRHPITALAAVAVTAGAAVLAAAGPAAAATLLYVNNTPGANCSDGGTGTPSQPYCSISAAVAVAVPDETINITGSYNEHVTITRSGASGQPITLHGGELSGSNAGLTIDGVHDVSIIGLSVRDAQSSPAVAISNSTRITLQGLRAIATTVTMNVGIQFTDVTDSSATNIGATGTKMSTGIALDATTTRVALKSVIATTNYPAGRTAIDIAGSNNTVTNGRFQGGTTAGMVLESSAANNIIANTFVTNGLAGGIYNLGATGTAITNNVVQNNCATGIRVDGASSGVSVQNNISSSNPAGTAACGPALPDAVDIGVYGPAVNGTVVDYNTVDQSVPGAYPYAWDNPMSLADFRSASQQAAHDAVGSGPSVIEDSANSAAPGFPSKDASGNIREDNPGVTNTGAGPITYADRGVLEHIQMPTAKLAVTVGNSGNSITADASGSVPSWAPMTYTFDFGDGTSVTQSTPTVTHRYAQAGNRTVSLAIRDANSQASYDSWQGCVSSPVATGPGARTLRADFNGDGRDDVAMLYDYGGGHVAVFTMTGHGCGQFDPPVLRWDGPWWGPGTKFLTTGDFNGDGKADIGLFYDYGGGHVAEFTLIANSNGNGGFAPPALRWNGPWWGPGTRFATAGDFNGDGKTDLALFYDYGGGHVAVFTLASTGSGLSAPVLRWNGPWWGLGTRFASAGDFNGDGKADLALLYDYGGGHVAVFTLPAGSGGGLSAPVLRWNGPWWGPGTVAMDTGRFTSDGKDDIVLFYAYTPSDAGLFKLAASSSGNGNLAAPTALWTGSWGATWNRHKFMVAGSFASSGSDGIALFRDEFHTPYAFLDTINPDAAGHYSAPETSWQSLYWGYGTVALG